MIHATRLVTIVKQNEERATQEDVKSLTGLCTFDVSRE